MTVPTPERIKKARMQANLSVKEASQLVKVTERAWHYWERGGRIMTEGLWELFLIKIGKIKVGE